jgi:hypothetical protein
MNSRAMMQKVITGVLIALVPKIVSKLMEPRKSKIRSDGS